MDGVFDTLLLSLSLSPPGLSSLYFSPLIFFSLCSFVCVCVCGRDSMQQSTTHSWRSHQGATTSSWQSCFASLNYSVKHWLLLLCVCFVLPLVSHEFLPCVLLCTDPRIPFSGVLSLTLSLRASVTCKYWMCGFPTSLDPPGALFPCCIVHGVNIYSLEIKALNCGLLNPASESYLPISLDNFSVLWVLGICIIDFLMLFHLYYFSKEEFLKFELN